MLWCGSLEPVITFVTCVEAVDPRSWINCDVTYWLFGLFSNPIFYCRVVVKHVHPPPSHTHTLTCTLSSRHTCPLVQVKAAVLDPDNDFNVERTLTKEDVQTLIQVSQHNYSIDNRVVATLLSMIFVVDWIFQNHAPSFKFFPSKLSLLIQVTCKGASSASYHVLIC